LEFRFKLEKIVNKNSSVLTIGLDPDKSKMPISDIFEFNKKIIDSTFDLVCAYKPNFAFYEKEGLEGINALYKTIDYIKSKDSDIIIRLTQIQYYKKWVLMLSLLIRMEEKNH